MEAITQIGVGGIFSILVLREVFGFLSKWRLKRNGNGNPGRKSFDVNGQLIERKKPPEACVRMIGQVDQLFSSHQADAIHLTHTREMLEKAVGKLAETVDNQSSVLQDISRATSQSCESLIIVQQRLTEISVTMQTRRDQSPIS